MRHPMLDAEASPAHDTPFTVAGVPSGRIAGVRRWFVLPALVASLSAGDVPSADAAISKGDSAATHAYLEAKLTLLKSEAQVEPSSLEDLEAFAVRLRGECPAILAGTPLASENSERNDATDELSQELIGAMFAPGENAGHAFAVRFYRSVKQLRWSDRKLTRMLRSLALE